LSGQCTAIKRNGERCTLPATGQQGVCWAHDPRNADKRRRTASRGGRGKPSREIRDLKKQLEDLAKDVLEGRVDRGNAVVVNQILNTRARLIELERKVKETEELEDRIERLEQTGQDQQQNQQRGGSGRWGA
jgi:hypothetical protein